MASLVTDLINKFARFQIKDQIASVESDNEDIYSDGQDVESVIKYDNTDKLFKSKRRYNDFEWLAT